MSPAGEGGREGLFAALKNLLATFLAIGKTRAELLVTEIEEEKYRLLAIFSKVVAAIFMVALVVIMTVAAVAMAFWEQRVWVFSLFALLFAGFAWALFSSLLRQMAEPSKLFRASLVELEKDMAQLRSRQDGSQ
ncbi:MAG: phage holin family protein [Rhodocyclales bacterium]|nr:phage holin family protein [Rhodocyclales bacterium]